MKQKDSRTGKVHEFLLIDVVQENPDGVKQRVRRSATIQNKREAEREEIRIRHEIMSGTYGKPKPPPARTSAPSFRDFAKEFLDTYAATNNKPSEVESKKSILDTHLIPAFGSLDLNQVDVERIEKYKAAKLKGDEKLAAKTINNHLSVLRKLLNVAQEWKRIDSVPKIRWLKAPDPEFRFFTFDEADALIANAADDWRAIIVTAMRTGLRLGELIALRWSDVDLDGGFLWVRRAVARGRMGTPKNGRSRRVELSDQVIAVLRDHPNRGELIFCDEGGNILTKGEMKWPLWMACTRAGVERVGWHVLRHTFASHLAMRGAPLKAIQELLGHATMEMTMRYAHLSPEMKRNVVKLLDTPK